jgi:O-acetylhomoserine (thiol)-lyase
MDGHGAAVGGCIVDSGKFDWTKYPEKFAGLCTPDESYHGVTYTERFGLEGAFITKATAQLMRDFGAIQAPQNAFLLNLGLESLHVRMKRHCENGLAVAKYLENNEKISWVTYPALESSKDHALAEKYMPDGTCGVVSFGVKGGREAAAKFMNALRLIAIETHVADARSCCLHPATTTHRQLSDADLIACGVGPDLVRLSCGIEDADDLIADIQQALDQI